MRRDFRENCPPRRRRPNPGGQSFSPRKYRPARSGFTEEVLGDISERSNKGVSTEDRPIQICFDFTKGRCARRNCKFSHDYEAIVKYNSKEQGICFDFLRGECNRGPLCRFSHDLSNVMKQWIHEMRMGNTFRFSTSGICYDFVRGQCPRGKRCRFSHDLREIAMTTSRQNENEISMGRIPSETNQGLVIPPQKSCGVQSIWKLPHTYFSKQFMNGVSTDTKVKKNIPLKETKETFVERLETRKILPLSNIRSRELLGRDLCRAMGIPTLNSTLTILQ